MRKKKIMIIALSVFGVLILILFIGKMNASVQFSKEVKELFAQSGSISDKTFHKNMIADLPEPVLQKQTLIYSPARPGNY